MQNIKHDDLTWFKSVLKDNNLMVRFKKIKLVISDVDGALTNAKVYVAEDGEGGRNFSTQDGFFVKWMIDHGINVVLISGKKNKSTEVRARYIGVPLDQCFMGHVEKNWIIDEICKKFNLTKEQILVYGDDLPDANMKLADIVELFICPANAPFYIQSLADLVLPREGGNNAFRLMSDLILYVQGKHKVQDLVRAALENK
jgi:3-deoxy-D-manno-octulosonate 8-phosphate phosphatase (KDO 8-P phosphatase)